MSGILQKLQWKPGQTSLVLNAPGDTVSAFEAPGVDLTPENALGKSFDFIIVFCFQASDISTQAAYVLNKLRKGGVLWFAYPKKSPHHDTDISRDNGWDTLTNNGLLPVRQVAIDKTWSALRFRFKEDIKALKRGTDYPGIDSSTKTVALPEDLSAALLTVGVMERFSKLSFTQRKEYVISILDAKKKETRAVRIEKILNQLQK